MATAFNYLHVAKPSALDDGGAAFSPTYVWDCTEYLIVYAFFQQRLLGTVIVPILLSAPLHAGTDIVFLMHWHPWRLYQNACALRRL